MMHPKCECPFDCPDRSPYCRSNCHVGQKYEAEMDVFNASKRVIVYTGVMTSGRKKMVEHIRKKG